jgi:hypothetical protein
MGKLLDELADDGLICIRTMNVSMQKRKTKGAQAPRSSRRDYRRTGERESLVTPHAQAMREEVRGDR